MTAHPLLQQLRSIRQAHGITDEAAGRAVDERLAARTATGPIPFTTDDRAARVTRFCEKAATVQTETVRLRNLHEVPQVLAESLRTHNVGPAIRIGQEPTFANLDWGGLEVSTGVGRVVEPVAVSRAALGVAETGTLVLLSGPDNPVTLGLLGERHYVVLNEADVVDNFEAVWAKLRADRQDPRTINLVTGPSRSADIEQRLELGAHGPVALTVLVIADATD